MRTAARTGQHTLQKRNMNNSFAHVNKPAEPRVIAVKSRTASTTVASPLLQVKRNPQAFRKARNIVAGNGLFRHDFLAWLDDNWHIWLRFKAEANLVWKSGRKHYSARTLIEYLRHETLLREVSGGYKINNSYVPDLGRLYGMINTRRADFFECRVMRYATIRATIRRGPQTLVTINDATLMAPPLPIKIKKPLHTPALAKPKAHPCTARQT